MSSRTRVTARIVDDPPVHWSRNNREGGCGDSEHGLGQSGATVSRPFDDVRSQGGVATRIPQKMLISLRFWVAFERMFW